MPMTVITAPVDNVVATDQSSAAEANSQSEFTLTRSDHSSELGADSSFDPSNYVMGPVDMGRKRPKRTNSSDFGGMFEFDRSHELEEDNLKDPF